MTNGPNHACFSGHHPSSVEDVQFPTIRRPSQAEYFTRFTEQKPKIPNPNPRPEHESFSKQPINPLKWQACLSLASFGGNIAVWCRGCCQPVPTSRHQIPLVGHHFTRHASRATRRSWECTLQLKSTHQRHTIAREYSHPP